MNLIISRIGADNTDVADMAYINDTYYKSLANTNTNTENLNHVINT